MTPKENRIRLAVGAAAVAALAGAVVSAGASDSGAAKRPAATVPLYAGRPIPTPPAGPEAAAALEQHGCTSCHLGERAGTYLFASYPTFVKTPPLGGAECARCHVNSYLAATEPHPAQWLPIGPDVQARMRESHSYVENPPVVLAVDAPSTRGARTRLARFTSCGLDQFLTAPMPRRGGAKQAMVPLEPERRRALLAALAPDLAPCDGEAPGRAEVERGRELFTDHLCATCHTADGVAPRLRLGIPLLARDYVAARVRMGTGEGAPGPLWQRGWGAVDGIVVARPAANAVVMPPHPDLTDADLDALYAYLRTDRSDVPVAPPPAPRDAIDVPESIRQSLYREVQTRVFDTTCRHCHADEPDLQAIIRGVFGTTDGASAPLALPTRRRPTPARSSALRAVLAPGPGCTDSRLIARLRARTHEWSGERPAGAPRGMPLTMPPLPEDAIRLAEIWSAAGCPSDAGDLCDRCQP